MSFRTVTLAGLAALSISVSGCADNQSLLGTSSNLTTSAVTPAAPKIDPACATLAAQIDGLRREGIADKVERATQKKAKVSLTAAETAKADQLIKANFEFQSKCSNFKPVVNTAAVTPSAAQASSAAKTTATAAKAAAQ